MAAPRICSIPDCDNQTVARGWCSAHYQRWKRHGTPLAGRTQNGALRDFIRNVAIPFDADECLMWPFGRLRSGYADISDGAKKVLVHRIVCESAHGKPPTSSHEAAHTCGNGKLGCVNPRHLRWKTHAENMADMIVHGSSTRGRHHGTKLTEQEVRQIRSLHRKVNQARLAELFGVCPDTISEIQRRITWPWLSDD